MPAYTSEADFFALTTIDAADANPHASVFWASKSLVNSHSSLRHLKFGCEKYLALSYLGTDSLLTASVIADFTLDVVDDIRALLPENLSEPSQKSSLPTSILTLETLHLIGIDCSVAPEVGALAILDIDQLTSLCLESCFNLGQKFPALSPTRNADAQPLLPQLRSFRLRQEGSDEAFQRGLETFLLATKGFIHLAVLLEGSGPFLAPDIFVATHGSTLETLVWEQRRGPRRKLDESTSTATSSMMSSPFEEIVKGCPNLRELGLAVNVLTNEDDDDDHDVSQPSSSLIN